MKEEKKDKKKKSIVLIIAAVAILLVAVVGATFAYFTASGGTTQNSLFNTTTESVDAVSCTSADVSLIVKAEDMAVSAGTAGGTAINPSNSTSNEDSNGTITCTAQKNSSSPTICTYDLVYTPAQGKAFTTYSAENDYSNPELTLQGSSSTTTGTIASGKTAYAETDMYTMQSQTTLIRSGSWTFSAAGSMTYTFTPTFYNYNFEQKDLANSSWGGTISVINLSCSPVNEAPEQTPADIYIAEGKGSYISYSPILGEGHSLTYYEDSQQGGSNATYYQASSYQDFANRPYGYGLGDSPFYLRLQMTNTQYWERYSPEGGYQNECPFNSCSDDFTAIGYYYDDTTSESYDATGCYTSLGDCNSELQYMISHEMNPGMGYDDPANFTCERKQTINRVYLEFVVSSALAQANAGMVEGAYSLTEHNTFAQNESVVKTAFDYTNHSDRCTTDTDYISCSVDGLTVTLDDNDTEKIAVSDSTNKCYLNDYEAYCGYRN